MQIITTFKPKIKNQINGNSRSIKNTIIRKPPGFMTQKQVITLRKSKNDRGMTRDKETWFHPRLQRRHQKQKKTCHHSLQ